MMWVSQSHLEKVTIEEKRVAAPPIAREKEGGGVELEDRYF